MDKTLKLIDDDSGEVRSLCAALRSLGLMDRWIRCWNLTRRRFCRLQCIPLIRVISCLAVWTERRSTFPPVLTCRTVLTDLITEQSLQSFRSNKFVVRVAFSQDGQYFATASYDHHIVIYKAISSALAPPQDEDEDMILDDSDDLNLACDPLLRYQEVHRIKVDSNPEAILFADGWLMYTLRSSYLLFYVKVDTWEKRTKSFNPHPLDTHVSFSVLNLSLHPSGKVVACQTGDRGAERVLIYGIDPDDVG